MSRKKNPNAEALSRVCTNCGGPVSPGGRRNPLGVYYCMEVACQNAKRRAYVASVRSLDQRPWAPSICSNPQCAKQLKPRRVRVGETPQGRWCDSPACRRHRMMTLKQGTSNRPAPPPDLLKELERHKAEILFYARALKFERVKCPACGVEDAVQGYPHPDEYAEKCTGTGESWVHRQWVARVWPDRWYYEGDTLVPLDD